MPSYAIVTFGCRVNQADSLVIEAGLRERGATPAPAHEADVVIVNTCSVTASADQGARQTIRRVARMNPGARIVVTGCYATRRPDDLASLPNVVRVVTNDDKDALAAHVGDAIGLPTSVRFGASDGPCGSPLEPGVAGRTALTLRVQTGCEERCSYCIIPRTRGSQRSMPRPRVRREIAVAVAAGYREIAITGVHLGSYGRDLGDGTSLETLAHDLAAWPDDVRFRISSLEPMDCPVALVRLMASSPRMAHHLHLPLQHGDDEMLAAMQRPYTTSQYRHLLETVVAAMPHAAVGTDLIVGFPGETDAQFERMCRLVEDLPLAYLHVFPYSDRPGTAASTFGRKIDGVVIRERGRRVREIGERLVRRFRASQAGTTHRALALDDGRTALTGNYLRVRLDPPRPRNTWVEVGITS